MKTSPPTRHCRRGQKKTPCQNMETPTLAPTDPIIGHCAFHLDAQIRQVSPAARVDAPFSMHSGPTLLRERRHQKSPVSTDCQLARASVTAAAATLLSILAAAHTSADRSSTHASAVSTPIAASQMTAEVSLQATSRETSPASELPQLLLQPLSACNPDPSRSISPSHTVSELSSPLLDQQDLAYGREIGLWLLRRKIEISANTGAALSPLG